MARPRAPHGGGHGGTDGSGTPSGTGHGRGDGDGDGGTPSRRRHVPGDAGHSITSAQEATARAAQQGRPGGDRGGPRPGGGDEGYRTPTRDTPEYDHRIGELAADPAHGGAISPKSRREAEVGLEAESQGKVPGPIRRAEIDNSDPAFQKDQGEFIDANGKNWDVKSPADTFPAGRMAGQPMPEGMKGRYNGDEFEQKLADEVSGGQNVIIDTKNLSEGAVRDIKARVDARPDWAGKVVFVE